MAARGRPKLTAEQKRERIREAARRTYAKHPERHRARELTRDAIAAGLIKPKPCLWCAATGNVHAHHENYADPLRVVFLCQRCHHRRHNQLRRWQEYAEAELYREAERHRRIRAKAAARRTKEGGI